MKFNKYSGSFVAKNFRNTVQPFWSGHNSAAKLRRMEGLVVL